MMRLNNQIKSPVWDCGFNKCVFKNYVFKIATFLKSQRHLVKHLYIYYQIFIIQNRDFGLYSRFFKISTP
jgi:hypothetical protein